MTAVFLDDGVGNRKPEAGPLANLLRRKKRVEDLWLYFLRNSRSIVIDLEHDGFAQDRIRITTEELVAERDEVQSLGLI